MSAFAPLGAAFLPSHHEAWPERAPNGVRSGCGPGGFAFLPCFLSVIWFLQKLSKSLIPLTDDHSRSIISLFFLENIRVSWAFKQR